VRLESAFRRSGLTHMSEVCCKLGFDEAVFPPDLLDDELGEHDPLSPSCWCGRLPREFWPPGVALATGLPGCGASSSC